MRAVQHQFTILHLNIRSCLQNFGQFVAYLIELNVRYDVMILSETWITADNENLFSIPSYDFISQNRDVRRGGGLRIYYLNNLVCNKIEDLSMLSETHESLFVKISDANNLTYVLGAFYRPPSCNISSFNNYLDNVLFTDTRLMSNKCILVGDFNIDLLKAREKQQTINFTNIMSEGGFKQLVEGPTRCELGLPKTLLDHFWINFSAKIGCSIRDFLISDHLPIEMSIARKISYNKIKIKFRTFSRENYDVFERDKTNIFHSYKIATNDVNLEMTKFLNWICSVVDIYFPYKVKHLSEKRIVMPWLNREVLVFINFKHKLFIKTKRKIIPYRVFKAFSSLLKILIERLKCNYFKRKFQSSKGDAKLIWKSINNILGRVRNTSKVKQIISSNDVELTRSDLIAKEFNEYFNSIPTITQAKLNNSKEDYIDLIPVNNKSMFLIPTTPHEVLTTVNNLKNKKSNDIPVQFLKSVGFEVSTILCTLFNLCFKSGCYPDILKSARTIPVLKSGNSNLLCNYRPMSLLPIFNKILEKLIYKRLVFFRI